MKLSETGSQGLELWSVIIIYLRQKKYVQEEVDEDCEVGEWRGLYMIPSRYT